MTTIDSRKRLVATLEEFMMQRGWSVSSARRSCQLFELRTEITPYVLCEPSRKHKEYLEVVGTIGVIHRPFERYWATLHPTQTYTDTLAMSLHLANLPSLHEARLISVERIEHDVQVLGTKLLDFLQAFPRDEQALRIAFQHKELAGRPIVNFSGYLERPKYEALEEFVSRVQH